MHFGCLRPYIHRSSDIVEDVSRHRGVSWQADHIALVFVFFFFSSVVRGRIKANQLCASEPDKPLVDIRSKGFEKRRCLSPVSEQKKKMHDLQCEEDDEMRPKSW